MRGLVIDRDEVVAKWAYTEYNLHEMPVDRAVGIIDGRGYLVGAALFHNFNGANVELSYYGPNTLTSNIARALARIAVGIFNVARLTVVTSKRNKRLIRGLLKLGFRLEGTQRCFYGHDDNTRNTGVRLAAFRDRIECVARMKRHDRRLSTPFTK